MTRITLLKNNPLRLCHTIKEITLGPSHITMSPTKLSGTIKLKDSMAHTELDLLPLLVLQLMVNVFTQIFSIQTITPCGLVAAVTGGFQMLSHSHIKLLHPQLNVTSIARSKTVAQTSLLTMIHLGDGAS